MADYASNYTNRLFIRYRAAGKLHEAAFRYGGAAAAPQNDIKILVGSFLTLLKPQLVSDFLTIGASYAVLNTSNRIPTDFVTVANDNNTNWTPGDAPRYYSFVGRSSIGNAARVFIYGALADPGNNGDALPQDYRVYSNESSVIAAAVEALDNEFGTKLVAVDGYEVTWAPYANVAYSAYYQRRARRI